MGFLLKAGFWLSVVVILIPTDKPKDGPAPVGAAEAATAAGAAFSDMRQFCSRQTEACAIGSHAASTFGQKAQAGAKMLYDFLSDHTGPSETGSASAKAPPPGATRQADSASQQTLTPADVTPVWRGQAPIKQVPPPRPRPRYRPNQPGSSS